AATASITTTLPSTNVGVVINNLPDNARVTVTFPNVNGTGPVSVSVGFLVGDVNSSRSIEPSDVTAVKSHAGEAASAFNFAYDINRSGAITAADILMAKRPAVSIPTLP